MSANERETCPLPPPVPCISAQPHSNHLVQAVKYQPKNLQAWNLLGLCQTSMGDIQDGIRAYQRAIDLQPHHKEAWVNMAQARKEVGLDCAAQEV